MNKETTNVHNDLYNYLCTVYETNSKCTNRACSCFNKIMQELEITIKTRFDRGHLDVKSIIWRCAKCETEVFIIDDHLGELLLAQKKYKRLLKREDE